MNFDSSPENLARMAAQGLRLDPPPTEGEIDDVLARLSAAFGAGPEIAAEARKLLHARFAIRMDMGETLISDDEHVPWLAARSASIDRFYWSRYRELLLKNGWPPLVAATLDRSTEDLLDLLGNPAEQAPWQRRGLVMGDVQSGKTASYAALICKAADAGYKMVILLTGILENVRRQTQERLDAAFVGLDSRDFLSGPQLQHKRHVGVGIIDPRRTGVVFTSRDHDFRKNAASALNISLNAVVEPVLVVSKKNKAVLGRLAGWLRARNADQEGKIDLPMLLIDDEADNASINTKQNPDETTAINKAIRDLLGLFRRSSYVGFTATPFANIFIDPSSTSEMLGDDLFPRDFIHVLAPPDNYVGMTQLFPSRDQDDEGVPGGGGPEHDDTLRSIADADDWLASGHKKDAEPGAFPESLRVALRCFLLSCAIRDLRAADGTMGRGGGIHRSMLVNVSRFTAVQNKVADAVHLELEEIRRAVRLHGGLPAPQAVAQSPEIAALADVFTIEFARCGQSWPAVLTALHDAIAPVRVQPVNQSTGGASLDYSVGSPSERAGVRVVAVGGNSLSRGLTLEGLSSSYFLRNARAYDTLMQMGRWFGFRDGYHDLCRVWLTEEAEGWCRHVTDATVELKSDFLRMKRRKATPREFGLRVRTHPGTLLITARNKMATGRTVDAVWDVSLTGRMVESTRLYSDRRRNEENLTHVEQLVGQLASATSCAPLSPDSAAVVWNDVPAGTIADFLDSFLVHPLNFDFQGDSIAALLREASQRNDPRLSRWTVVLPIAGKSDPIRLNALPDVTIRAGLRKVKLSREDGSLLLSGKSSRVGGRSDLRHAFTPETFAEVTGGRNDFKEADVRKEMGGPLLVIYLLRGYEAIGAKSQILERLYRDGLVLPAFGLHFPGSEDPDSPRILVRYRLNRVAQKELFPDLDDEDNGVDADADADD